MEQANHQTQQTMNQIFLIKPLNLKKITQLIFSAYVLSFLFSWLSFRFLWTFPIRLFSHSIDKRCMFLIFNGILVLIASNSGLTGSGSPESDHSDELTLSVDSLKSEAQAPLSVDSLVSEAQAPLLDDEVVVEKKREGEEFLVTKYDQEEEEKTEVFLSKDEEEKESEVNNFVEEGGGEEEMMSTEDLNKKFDDFIRKMKQEIKIEAQQQLVVSG